MTLDSLETQCYYYRVYDKITISMSIQCHHLSQGCILFHVLQMWFIERWFDCLKLIHDIGQLGDTRFLLQCQWQNNYLIFKKSLHIPKEYIGFSTSMISWNVDRFFKVKSRYWIAWEMHVCYIKVYEKNTNSC